MRRVFPSFRMYLNIMHEVILKERTQSFHVTSLGLSYTEYDI